MQRANGAHSRDPCGCTAHLPPHLFAPLPRGRLDQITSSGQPWQSQASVHTSTSSPRARAASTTGSSSSSQTASADPSNSATSSSLSSGSIRGTMCANQILETDLLHKLAPRAWHPMALSEPQLRALQAEIAIMCRQDSLRAGVSHTALACLQRFLSGME